jgi:hypothetical protein
LEATECPELCSNSCNDHSYCDCGSQMCLCKPGFGGTDCSLDLCAAARCGEHGHCTATYLGSSSLLPVTSSDKACICDRGWSGNLCQYNPCETLNKSCSGHGECAANGLDAVCECDAGYSGANCEVSCDGFCQGSYPYNCNPNLNDVILYGCNQFGGCAYKKEGEGELGSSFCVFKEVGGGNQCVCESENECATVGSCNDLGECPDPSPLPDGTPCNSIPWGLCQNGVCTDSIPPTPTPPTPTPPTPTPPTSSCTDARKSQLKIVVKTDSKGEEVSWVLRKQKKNGKWRTIRKSGSLASNRKKSKKMCLPNSKCYKFVISDTGGDGICCSFGDGWYKLSWNGKLFHINLHYSIVFNVPNSQMHTTLYFHF